MFLILVNKNYANIRIADFFLICACVVFSMTIAAINAVKVPDSDLVGYIASYEASSEFNIFQYMLIGSNALTSLTDPGAGLKEPCYAVIVWILNRILFGNVPLFKFSLTLINYFLLTFSAYIFGKKLNLSKWKILLCIFLLCFIPYIFTMSLQLLRQFLAGSILIYILVEKCFSDISMKKLISLSLLMVFTHSTAFLFLPFIFLPAFDKKYNQAKVWYVMTFVGLAGIQIVASFALGFVGSGSSMGYALERASSDTTFDLAGVALLTQAMIAGLMLGSLYLGHFSKYGNRRGVRRFCNLIIFVSIFIFANLHQAELSSRLAFYLYPLIPFIIVLFVDRFKIRKGFMLFFSLLVFVSFIAYVYYGVWDYDLPFGIIASPLYFFLV